MTTDDIEILFETVFPEQMPLSWLLREISELEEVGIVPRCIQMIKDEYVDSAIDLIYGGC